MKHIILTVLAATALGACASAPGEPAEKGIAKYAGDARLGEKTNKICFASSIDGFSMNDRDTVLLHDGKKRYMVEVTGTCFDLENAESIGLDSPTSCLTPGDSIIVAETFGETFGSRRCMIREIYEWDPKAGEPEEKAEENPG
jgi:hypothetical protein